MQQPVISVYFDKSSLERIIACLTKDNADLSLKKQTRRVKTMLRNNLEIIDNCKLELAKFK